MGYPNRIPLQALRIQTSRTLERAFVVAGFDRLNPLEPHHATALGARWVFHVIDRPFHREIKARTDAQAQLSASDDDDHRSTASKNGGDVPPDGKCPR